MRPESFSPVLSLRRLSPLGLGVMLLLGACSSAPRYEKPVVDTPAAFREAALFQPARPEAADVPDAWWTLFGDPVLDELQRQVAIGNENLKNSVAQYRIAQAALGTSRAGLYPTFTLGLGATRSATGSVTPTGSVQGTSYTLSGAMASWEIDLWGRLSGAVDAAQAKLQASQGDLAAAQLSAQATLAQTYFSLRAYEAQAALLERTIAAYQRSLELTQNRYRGGVASSADVEQAQTQLKSTQAQLIEANSNRAQMEHALAVLVGKPPAAFSVARTASLPKAPEAPVQLPATLLERRPDIAAAERRVAAANAQIGVAKAAFFPALTLSASAGFRSSSLSDLIGSSTRFWSIGPSLALAAFDGGARRAAEDSARASLDQAAATYRQTVLTAFQEVEDNLVIAASLREEAAIQAEALASARRVLEVTDNQYRAGTVSYLNVVSAQATVLSTESSLLNVRNRQLVALGQLLKNIAGRWDVPVPAASSRPDSSAAPPVRQAPPPADTREGS